MGWGELIRHFVVVERDDVGLIQREPEREVDRV